MREIVDNLTKQDLKKMHSLIVHDIWRENKLEMRKPGVVRLFNKLIENLKQTGRGNIVSRLEKEKVIKNGKIINSDIAKMKFVQIMLDENGYRGKNGKRLQIDGSFGENTFWALINYQREGANNYKNISLADVEKNTGIHISGNINKEGEAEGLVNGRTIFSWFKKISIKKINELKQKPANTEPENEDIKNTKPDNKKPDNKDIKNIEPDNKKPENKKPENKKPEKVPSIKGKKSNLTGRLKNFAADKNIADKNIFVPDIKDPTNIEAKKSRANVVELNKKNEIFHGTLQDLIFKVDSQLEKKLGTELFEKFNEKIHMLGNMNIFSKYTEIYSKKHNKDYFFHAIFDEIDQVDLFKQKYKGKNYIKSIEKLISFVLDGKIDKEKLSTYLDEIDKKVKKEIDKIISMQEWKAFETKLDVYERKRKIFDLLQNGDLVDIEAYFADEQKEPMFIENDIINSVRVKGLDIDKILDSDLDEAVEEAYNKLHYNFYIQGKRVNLTGTGLKKKDIKDILEDARKESSNLSKIQRKNYIYGVLVAKQLSESEQRIKSLFKNDKFLSKKLDLYYKHDSDWNKFLDHWKSNVVKGLVLAGSMIVTDGLVAGLIPEGAILGMGGLRFTTRVAALQNVGGDMSLLLNDQLNSKNALNVAKDVDGYIHTAAYMGVLEIFGALSKGLSKTEGIKNISGKLESIKGGKFVKNLSIYGFNVAGLFTIDTLIFDGKFTPEEVMNVLIFAKLMGKIHIEVKKGKDGKIKIDDLIDPNNLPDFIKYKNVLLKKSDLLKIDKLQLDKVVTLSNGIIVKKDADAYSIVGILGKKANLDNAMKFTNKEDLIGYLKKYEANNGTKWESFEELIEQIDNTIVKEYLIMLYNKNGNKLTKDSISKLKQGLERWVPSNDREKIVKQEILRYLSKNNKQKID